jgi:hypothetical protein
VIPHNHFKSPRGRLGEAPRRHRRRHRAAGSSPPPRARPELWPPELAHAAAERSQRVASRAAVKMTRRLWPQAPRSRRGALSWVSSNRGQRDRWSRTSLAAAAPSANTALITQLALPAERATTHSALSAHPLWPVCPVHLWPYLRCPPRPWVPQDPLPDRTWRGLRRTRSIPQAGAPTRRHADRVRVAVSKSR